MCCIVKQIVRSLYYKVHKVAHTGIVDTVTIAVHLTCRYALVCITSMVVCVRSVAECAFASSLFSHMAWTPHFAVHRIGVCLCIFGRSEGFHTSSRFCHRSWVSEPAVHTISVVGCGLRHSIHSCTPSLFSYGSWRSKFL